MPNRDSSPGGGGASTSTNLPAPSSSCRACAGATFYSRAAAAAGTPPTCAGLSRKLSEDALIEPAALPPDVAPHGDFSFICVGLASYPDGPAATPPPHPTTTAKDGVGMSDDVALPQCFGVQIIRAQAIRATPLEAGAAALGSGGGEDTRPDRRPPRRDPLAAARRGAPGGASSSPPPSLPALGDALAGMPDLAAKVGQSAKKVADKMVSNAAAGAAAARKAAESLVDTVLPGGGGRDK
jgi:hypothetical protein